MTLEYRGILTVCLLLLGGCAMPPGGMNPGTFSAQPAMFEVDPLFKPGMLLLTADTQPKSPAASAADDWVLLGIKVTHEDQQDVWFVRLSGLPVNALSDRPVSPTTKEFSVPFGVGPVKTGEKFTAPVGKLLIETYDSQGTLLRCSLRTVPNSICGASLLNVLSGCEPLRDVPANGAGATVQGDDVASMLTMMQLMGGSKALTPIRDSIRDQVVQKPSLIGIWINCLALNVQAKVEQCRMLQSPWTAGGMFAAREEAKFPVILAGQRLFDCRLIVGPTDPPYNLTAGALMFEAVHPEKKQNRLMICVLAAKHEKDEADCSTAIASRSH
jgi:hypothetical protein